MKIKKQGPLSAGTLPGFRVISPDELVMIIEVRKQGIEHLVLVVHITPVGGDEFGHLPQPVIQRVPVDIQSLRRL